MSNNKNFLLIQPHLESIADMQNVYINNIEDMVQSVYKELKTQNVDLTKAMFVYAAFGEPVGVAKAKNKLACVYVPDLSTSLYFSDK